MVESFSEVADPGLRRWRVRRSFGRLSGAIDEWAASWQKEPDQFSQITRLRSILEQSLARIRSKIEAVNTADRTATSVECRNIDLQIALVERIWQHYKVRFDQRRDERTGDVLRAADDVIWSCYADFAALKNEPALPLPLAYLEPLHSANAIPRDWPPSTLAPFDALLADLLRQLPVPLIGVPTIVVDEPWWLAVLAHEVGHHVQFDLEQQAMLVQRTADVVSEHEPASVRERWASWKYEIFADACSVACLGETASLVIADLEWGSTQSMCSDRKRYPPVAVRLALMAAVGECLGFAGMPFGAAEWRALLEGALPLTVEIDLSRVPGKAEKLVQMPLGSTTLRELAGRANAKDGSVGGEEASAMEAFLSDGNTQLTRSRHGARIGAAAAFRAFRTVRIDDDSQRSEALAALNKRTLNVIRETAEDTVVKGEASSVDADMWSKMIVEGAEALAHSQGSP